MCFCFHLCFALTASIQIAYLFCRPISQSLSCTIYMILTRTSRSLKIDDSVLYWHVFRRWCYLRRAAGMGRPDEPVDETVLLEGRDRGQRISLVQAYPYCGEILRDLSLYEYMSIVKLKRKGSGADQRCDDPFGLWLLKRQPTRRIQKERRRY